MENCPTRGFFYVALVFVLSACATRYVDKPIEKESAADTLVDVVAFQSSEDFRKSPPACLGVMPLEASKVAFQPTNDLRKAIHAHIAPSGILLVPLHKIDAHIFPARDATQNLKSVAQGTSCDTLLSGELTERESRFWGIYSEIRMGASLRITRVSTGQVIWRGQHTAVGRNGGIPLSPLGFISGVVSAGINLREEQLTRTTHDLARRLVNAIPELKFANQDGDLVQNEKLSHSESVSVYAFIASIQDYSNLALDEKLAASIEGGIWADPHDRLALGEFWLKRSPKNVRAIEEIANARLKLGEPEAALRYIEQAVELDPKNPEILFLKGRAYLQLNDPEQAAQSILSAAILSPRNPSYFLALGLAYNQMGSYDRAVAALIKHTRLVPTRPFAQMHLGIAYVGIGDDAQAAKSLSDGLALSLKTNDHRSAAKIIQLIKSMNLESFLSGEDLSTIDNRAFEVEKL